MTPKENLMASDGDGVGQAIKTMKAGASVWTTFRFLANIVYGLCWILALPVEMVLNRRVGRRYSSILPLTISVVLVSAFLRLVGVASAKAATEHPELKIAAASLEVSLGFLVVMALAVIRQRVASWWRLRTSDQVHSFSSGIPLWLCPPTMLTARLRNSPPKRPVEQRAAPTTVFGTLCDDAGTAILAEVRNFYQAWLHGRAPTGAIAWYGATVVQPLLLVGVAYLVAPVEAALGIYLVIAAIAILVKARIQKALVIESIYDIFDARIEQDFMRSLGEPQRLDSIERQGIPVPGLARIVSAEASSTAGQLPPDYARLITVSSEVEMKPGGGRTASDWVHAMVPVESSLVGPGIISTQL
jgi:hypothetical protein